MTSRRDMSQRWSTETKSPVFVSVLPNVSKEFTATCGNVYAWVPDNPAA